jgi:hypothetical protein
MHLSDLCLRCLEELCLKNLAPDVESPFIRICGYQTFASTLARSQQKPPAASTSSCGGCITYKDKTLEVARWRTGLRQIYEQTKKQLHALCNHQDIPVTIPAIVADDMTERRRGYSWLDNGQFVKPHALMEILIKDEALGICTKGLDGLIFKTGPMRNLMDQASQIIEGLSILCSTLPGQTARAAEFVEHKIRNSTRPRTFFRNDGADWLVTRRLKTENLTHKEAFVPSKLPPELQELLDSYLLTVRPMEEDFARRLWGPEVALLYHEYLFVSHRERFTADKFSTLLEDFGQRFWNCGASIRYYRHITVEMARIYLGSEYEIHRDELDQEEDAVTAQRGHQPLTCREEYAPEHGLLPALTSDLMHRYGRASEWWWHMTGFAPGKPPLLPLLRRRGIRHDSNVSHGAGEGLSNADALPGINMAMLMEQMTAMVTTSVSGLKLELERHIETAVAAGVAQAFGRYHHPGQDMARITYQSNSHPLKRPMPVDPLEDSSGTLEIHPAPAKRMRLTNSELGPNLSQSNLLLCI